ncbi:unnamed protein product [Cyprideis torosa]|uniref:Uncharacterized protein n=1 Tax=Cyprideis torosa TaxID=163714 RepID=A0A7R8ZKY4_9CRUS|nr:unnamed protein product [Cyprideis torosa]CAG0885399.1 unnamed protein product [Cyprideis torosa]
MVSASFRKTTQFVGRTVMVRNGQIDEAMRALTRIMASEGILDQWRRTRRYEKPCKFRARVNYERARAIYSEDMERKIRFVLRKNREDPFPGCG